MTKEGGDHVSRPKRYYILPFYPIISEVRLRQEVVNNPLACQDAFRDDWMGMWRVHVHQRRLHAPRLSDDDDGSCRLPPPPPPPPPLPVYDVADLRFPPSSCRDAASASGTRLLIILRYACDAVMCRPAAQGKRACLHLAQPRNMTKEGGGWPRLSDDNDDGSCWSQ